MVPSPRALSVYTHDLGQVRAQCSTSVSLVWSSSRRTSHLSVLVVLSVLWGLPPLDPTGVRRKLRKARLLLGVTGSRPCASPPSPCQPTRREPRFWPPVRPESPESVTSVPAILVGMTLPSPSSSSAQGSHHGRTVRSPDCCRCEVLPWAPGDICFHTVCISHPHQCLPQLTQRPLSQSAWPFVFMCVGGLWKALWLLQKWYFLKPSG